MENNTLDNRPNQLGTALLPNSTTVLVLGILSLVFCFAYGFIGLILGIVGLVLANKDLVLVAEHPGHYAQSSINNLKAGRTCAIIGVIISGIFILFIIGMLVFVGTMVGTSAFQ